MKLIFTTGFTIEERNHLVVSEKGSVDTFRFRNSETISYSQQFVWKDEDEKKGQISDYYVVYARRIIYFEYLKILNIYTGSDQCPIKLTWKQYFGSLSNN